MDDKTDHYANGAYTHTVSVSQKNIFAPAERFEPSDEISDERILSFEPQKVVHKIKK